MPSTQHSFSGGQTIKYQITDSGEADGVGNLYEKMNGPEKYTRQIMIPDLLLRNEHLRLFVLHQSILELNGGVQ